MDALFLPQAKVDKPKRALEQMGVDAGQDGLDQTSKNRANFEPKDSKKGGPAVVAQADQTAQLPGVKLTEKPKGSALYVDLIETIYRTLNFRLVSPLHEG